jgi:FkbM family methyltransferase
MASSSWEKRAIWLEFDYADEIELKNDVLHYKKLNLHIPKGEMEGMIKYYPKIKALKEVVGANFSYKNKEVEVEIGGIKCIAQTGEDFFILYEIFLEQVYNFDMPFSNIVVMDIGMNVGLASLYFATKNSVTAVYGYEPFEPTFNQAKENIKLNAALAAKIIPNHYGLDAVACELSLEYNYDNKGSVGVLGKDFSAGQNKIRIQLKPIADALAVLEQKHPEANLFLKIDCEGAEYDIFDYFKNTGIPASVKMIAMEWHKKGPEVLIETLKKEGFASFSLYTEESKELGMIYAIRTKN